MCWKLEGSHTCFVRAPQMLLSSSNNICLAWAGSLVLVWGQGHRKCQIPIHRDLAPRIHVNIINNHLKDLHSTWGPGKPHKCKTPRAGTGGGSNSKLLEKSSPPSAKPPVHSSQTRYHIYHTGITAPFSNQLETEWPGASSWSWPLPPATWC